jgi:FkbM family methyltransferase
MGTQEPAQPNQQPTARRVGRRDLLAGGLGGLAGLAAGAVAGRTLLAKAPPPAEIRLPEGAKPSYAQFGDDLVADSLLRSIHTDNPTYLDIGANDPILENNTYMFYLAGCRGVLVEPNVTLSERLRTVRPEDKLLVAGIGVDETPEADYYMLKASGLNTFDKEQAERMVREKVTVLEKVVKMPLLSINKVIAENFGGKAPDFVSIDIEGLDYAVLNTLDFKKYRPKLICAETLITNTLKHNPDTTKLLTDNGYEVRGMTFPNTFYLDKALLKG